MFIISNGFERELLIQNSKVNMCDTLVAFLCWKKNRTKKTLNKYGNAFSVPGKNIYWIYILCVVSCLWFMLYL